MDHSVMYEDADFFPYGRCSRGVVDRVLMEVRFVLEQTLVLIPGLLQIKSWLSGLPDRCALFRGEYGFGSIDS